MDPISNLKEQRRLCKEIQELSDATGHDDDIDANLLEHKALQLVELVEALDGWMLRGGFSPWAKVG